MTSQQIAEELRIIRTALARLRVIVERSGDTGMEESISIFEHDLDGFEKWKSFQGGSEQQ